jgi:hypothetical protein
MSLTRLFSRTAALSAAFLMIAALSAAPAAADPVLSIRIIDTLEITDSASVWVDVFITNTADSVAGFEMTIMLDRPDLVEFFDNGGVPAIDTAGALISGWGLVSTSFFGGPFGLRIVAMATSYPHPPVQSLAPRTDPGLLFRMKMGIFPYVPGTLPEREVILMILENISMTSFADENGDLIGVAYEYDTAFHYWHCLEWQGEDCLSWEEVFTPEEADSTSYDVKPMVMFDSTLSHYENGTVRVAPLCHGVCGDANGDGIVNVGDAVFIINYVFRGGPWPGEDKCADPNNDYVINVGDAIFLVNFIFRGYTAPECAPHW